VLPPPVLPLQDPKPDWQPVPQYAADVPQYPYWEQQLPKPEFRHVCPPLLEPQFPPVETGCVEVALAAGALLDFEAEGTTDLERVVAGLVPAETEADLLADAEADLLAEAVAALVLADPEADLEAEAEADLLTETLADLVALALADFVLAFEVAVDLAVLDLTEEEAAPRGVVEYHSETGIPRHSPTVTLRRPRDWSSEMS